MKIRRGSPVDIKPSTDQLHHYVLHHAKPLHHLEQDKTDITRTRFRMGQGGYNRDMIQNGIVRLLPVRGGKGSVTQRTNFKAVIRSAPATPGLITLFIKHSQFKFETDSISARHNNNCINRHQSGQAEMQKRTNVPTMLVKNKSGVKLLQNFTLFCRESE